MPHIYPQNCPFPFDDLHPHLTHPSLDRPHSPPQTSSRSTDRPTNKPTDSHTDGIDDKFVPITPAYALLYYGDAANYFSLGHHSPARKHPNSTRI